MRGPGGRARAAGRPAQPPRTRPGSLSHPGSVPASPELSRLHSRVRSTELLGVPGPRWGSFFWGRNGDRPCGRCGWAAGGGGAGVAPAGSGQVRSPAWGPVPDRPAARKARALLPRPARRSRLSPCKFLGNAGTSNSLARGNGRREELGAAPSPPALGPQPLSPLGARVASGRPRVPGCRGDYV